MQNPILDMALGSLISVAITTLAWYVFQRREARRDQEVADLKAEVRQLRDEKMGEFNERLTADHRAHGDLHSRINNLAQAFVPRTECALLCGKIDHLNGQLTRQGAMLTELRDSQTKTATVVDLIAKRMNINFEGAAHGP